MFSFSKHDQPIKVMVFKCVNGNDVCAIMAKVCNILNALGRLLFARAARCLQIWSVVLVYGVFKGWANKKQRHRATAPLAFLLCS